MTDLLLFQRRTFGAMQGRDEALSAASESVWTQIYEALGRTENRQETEVKMNALLTPELMRKMGVADSQKPVLVVELSRDSLRDWLHYDAASTLGALTVPVLALNGSLDRLVPPAANLAAIRTATAKNPDVTVLALPGLNHQFQPARSGTMGEYEEIKETFEPNALRTIGDWINARFNRRKQEG